MGIKGHLARRDKASKLKAIEVAWLACVCYRDFFVFFHSEKKFAPTLQLCSYEVWSASTSHLNSSLTPAAAVPSRDWPV